MARLSPLMAGRGGDFAGTKEAAVRLYVRLSQPTAHSREPKCRNLARGSVRALLGRPAARSAGARGAGGGPAGHGAAAERAKRLT
jgi:hypothetical protein